MTKAPQSLKARALVYLAAREYSRAELARRLARHAGQGDDVEALLDELEAAKLLSQARFSESLIHRRAAKFGNARILSELQSHGIAPDALEDIRTRLDGDEVSRAREVWRKKYGVLPAAPAEYARQVRFLSQRGFSPESIRRVLGSGADNEDP